MNRRLFVSVVTVSLAATMVSPPASAHWCSNIYQTYARIVVKPDRDQLDVAVGETKELKVRVRNQFPYTLHYIKLRANPPDGLTVTVDPDEDTAERIRVYAGQVLTFTLQITRESEGSDDVQDLNLEVNTTVEDIGPSWRDSADDWVDPSPSADTVRDRLENNPAQSRALNYGKLADLACAGCEQEGVVGLVELWAARLDPCDPGGFDGTNPMQFMRAGLHLAIRLRFADFNNPSRAQVVETMVNAMDDAHDITRGYAAFLAAYGGDDAGVRDRIEAMVESDPDGICSFEPSANAQVMAKAALLVLGDDTYHADVTACVDDGEIHTRARIACAAALGMHGEDAPVEGFLLDHVTDGKNTSEEGLYASYLLNLVVYARRGGPDGTGEVTFLSEEPLPQAPGGGCSCATGTAAGAFVILPLIGLVLVLRPRRRRLRYKF